MNGVSSTANWRRLHDLAFMVACRFGIDCDDAEDFACDFALHGLVHPNCSASQRGNGAYWYAEKRALDALRRRKSLKMTHATGPDVESSDSDFFGNQRQENTTDDCGRLARNELCVEILQAGSRLDQAQRELFDLSFLADLDPSEIAAKTGRTPHAIRQALSGIRKQVRNSLNRRGVSGD